MRALPLLLALLVLAGCRFERVAPAPDPAAVAAAADRAPGADPLAQRIARPPSPDGEAEVVLYVTEWCPYCAQAREWMDAEGVPHRVVDIEKSADGAAEYAARGGTGPIPLVAVGDQVMQGWSADYAEEMLRNAGLAPGE